MFIGARFHCVLAASRASLECELNGGVNVCDEELSDMILIYVDLGAVKDDSGMMLIQLKLDGVAKRGERMVVMRCTTTQPVKAYEWRVVVIRDDLADKIE